SPPASGEPRDWDKVVQPPCPDLASPRPPIPPASWLTSAANRPPCRGRQNPRHSNRPGGTFPRVVQPLDKDLGKGTKGRRLEPSPRRESGAFRRPPAPISSEAQALHPSPQGPPRAPPRNH